MNLINDRKLIITTGANRFSKNWQRLELNYSDFIDKLRRPTKTPETLAEFLKLPKSKQDELKDVGGFVGGALSGNRRKSESIESRDLISLDFDNISSGMTDDVIKRVQTLGCGYVIYSTRKHAEYKPRLRIIIPTNRSVSVDEYEPIARKVAALIGIEMADPTTFEPSRLMYWPSCSSDSTYVFRSEDKPFLDADGVLNQYVDWKDISSWPQVPGADVKHRKLLTQQENPTNKPGLVGAFCRTYDIYSAMDKFIPEAYDRTGNDERFTYMGGSTYGGAIIYQDGLFLFSHHATDPCGGRLVNAWDLVRLHKYSQLDDDAEVGTPVAKLPSFTAMKNLVRQDKSVLALLDKERQDSAKSYFTDIGQNAVAVDSENIEEDDSWREALVRNKNGDIEKSISNIVLVLTHDPQFKGKFWVDEFANRSMTTLPLPWDDGEGNRDWRDSDDAQLALKLEREYGLTGDSKIEKALKVVGDNNRKNEVKTLLESFRWDGVERIPTLLHDYLGAEQSVYTADIMKKSLAAAVARAVSNVGVKFDSMVIFTGKQGIGKSTFLSKLGMSWFSDSLYSFEGKDAAELIQGTLINEVGELSAMNKSETEAIKQFLSKTQDIYRAAYGRHTAKYPRRCVFFGSTNSQEFLKDETGNRRFWPVKVGEYEPTKSIFKDLDGEITNIWAEAYTYYMLGEKLFLEGESLEISERMQETFREIDPWQGEIEEFLNMKIPIDWYDLGISNQRLVVQGRFPNEKPWIDRDRVCAKEIWLLCLGGDMRYYTRRESNRINNILLTLRGWEKVNSTMRYGNFGTQKGFKKSKIIPFSEVNQTKKFV